MVWFPRSAARQPRASFSSNADSMGYRQSSEVTSTRAIVLTSSQEVFSGVNSASEFLIVFLMLILNLISRHLRSKRLGVLYWNTCNHLIFSAPNGVGELRSLPER